MGFSQNPYYNNTFYNIVGTTMASLATAAFVFIAVYVWVYNIIYS